MKFIDIHGHYAWGIDDGISTMEEAKEALEKVQKSGVVALVATPHVFSGTHTENDIITYKQRIRDLKLLAKEYGILVAEGCELMLTDNTYEQVSNKRLIPFEDTNYVLCEYNVRTLTNTDIFMENFESYIYQVIDAGYTPIIAHIERYFLKEIDLDYVQYLVNLGCVIQMNTTSFLQKNNENLYRNSIALLDNNLVHVIATDTHSSDGFRSPNMKEAYIDLMKKGYDLDYLDLLFYKNPMKLLKNEEVIAPNGKKRTFLRTLSQRRKAKKIK